MVPDRSTVMFGGFMGCGSPHAIIDALLEKGVKGITLICNDNGFPDYGVGKLVVAKRVAKTIASHVGLNPPTAEQLNSGELEVELVPQGTLAERIRSAGAGLGGFLTPTGVGTPVQEGKEVIVIDGRSYLLEKPLRADVALLRADKADKRGNLIYNFSAQNFNPLMAMAATTVIAEVKEIVEIGEIDPNTVHTPGIFVDYLVRI
jgi:acetate CoA/acetoacetate CoA-transferase alpha subunit